MRPEAKKLHLPAQYSVLFLLLLLVVAFATQNWDLLPSFYLRGFLWLCLGIILARTGTLRRFDYFLWFTINVMIAFGLAPWSISLVQMGFSRVDGFEPDSTVLQNGTLTNDVVFVFVVITLAVRLLFLGRTNHIQLAERSSVRDHGRLTMLGVVLFTLGMSCRSLSILNIVPKQVEQLVNLFSNLTFFGLSLLCCSLVSMRRENHPWRSIPALALVSCVLVYGIINFIAGGGHKGALFNTIEIFVLLFITQSPGSAKPTFLVLGASGALLFFLAPAMNAYKEQVGDSDRKGFSENLALLRSQDYLGNATSEIGSIGALSDYWIDYGLHRVVMIEQSSIYVSAHWENGIDVPAHLKMVMQSLVPRLFAPEKMSSDVYYNTIARDAGVGGVYDELTSRKPDLISESIILGSYTSVIVIAMGYSLILIFMHNLIARVGVCDELKLATIVTTLSLGQSPYLAGLIPAVVFTVPFYLLFSRFVCQPWLNGVPRRTGIGGTLYPKRNLGNTDGV
jgi:hypothetical protein